MLLLEEFGECPMGLLHMNDSKKGFIRVGASERSVSRIGHCWRNGDCGILLRSCSYCPST